MTENTLTRRSLLQSSGLAALAAAAGCYTQTDSGSDPIIGMPGGPSITELGLGDWQLVLTDSLSAVDVDDRPTIVGELGTGDLAVFNMEAGMATNADGTRLVVEQTIDDVDVDTFPTLAILTSSGETAIIEEESYNG